MFKNGATVKVIRGNDWFTKGDYVKIIATAEDKNSYYVDTSPIEINGLHKWFIHKKDVVLPLKELLEKL